jgi:PRC-barrel domain.
MLEGVGQSAETERAIPRTSRKVLFGYSHFRDFQGMKVENVDGQKIGTINDLIMEIPSGRPAYVIVKSAGFAVGHRRFVIVPASGIAFRTAKTGIAALDLTKDQWKGAPEFSRKDLASLDRAQRKRELFDFYKLAEESPRPPAGVPGQAASLSSTGRADQTVSPGRHKGFELANDLIGSQVVGRQQIAIGKISDMLVDFTGAKPAFAVVSADRLSGTEAHFAVPVRLLGILPGRSVVLNADRQNFDRARPFRENDVQNSARSEDGEIYRYER